MPWTVRLRIKTIKNYSNYVGMSIDAREIIDAVIVTITSYRKYGNKVHEFPEFWIVHNATLEDNKYLDMEAYPIQVALSHKFGRVIVTHIRRWRR